MYACVRMRTGSSSAKSKQVSASLSFAFAAANFFFHLLRSHWIECFFFSGKKVFFAFVSVVRVTLTLG